MTEVKADTAQYSCTIAGEVFQVLSFDCSEAISQLFRIKLSLWLDDPEVDIASKIRQPAEVRISWAGKEKRYLGIVASMSQTEAGLMGEVDQEYGHYSVEIVPSLWLLGQQRSCKIFQGMSPDQVITSVLDAKGMAGKYELKLESTPPVREYTVQYRETDLAFISRLMEEEGMFYLFTHEGKEMMRIGNGTSAYATCSPDSRAEYKKGTGRLSTAQEYLSHLLYEESAFTGKVAYKDFDYDDPKKPLKVEQTGPANTDLEIYDYHPERYDNEARGTTLARLAVEARSAMRKRLEASGTWRSVSAGAKLTLEKAYRKDLNMEWLVVSASHSASQQSGGGVAYHVSIVAIPASVIFRPLPRTPQPTLGPQTAMVVGPPGEEIYMDELGRAKVQLHWDLDGKNDDQSSCWIRVAQHYAGIHEDTQRKHGFHWHPLIGDEVVVDFLEGDPDQPLIVGSVYNGDNRPPIKPEEHIRNMILTRYQHRLLLDDKNRAVTLNTPYSHTLLLDDPKKMARLSTEYGSELSMWDPHDDNKQVPNVTLRTGGNESLILTDGDSNEGNNIKLSTADGHGLAMIEGSSGRQVEIRTKERHVITLDDKGRNLRLVTTDGHQVLLDDDKKTIVVTSKDAHRLEINDRSKFIEVADSSGQHRFKIDINGKQLTIATDTGSIDIKAPSGVVAIDAQKITLAAKTDLDIKCGDLKADAKGDLNVSAGKSIQEKAGAKHSIKAAKIKQEATASLDMKAASITSKAQMSNTQKGMMVKSEAGGINTIKGTLVKIN